MKLEYKIKENLNNQTINTILKTELNISTRLLTKLIKSKRIFINNELCNTKNIAHFGDILKIDFDYSEDNSNIIPTKINLNIIYEDEWMLVVNKPSGIPIHPSRLHYTDSLSNGIKFYFDSICLNKKIRPVNRLDIDTSGVVIFAKCEYIQECFTRQMQENRFKKEYLCLVERYFGKKIWNYKFANCKKK